MQMRAAVLEEFGAPLVVQELDLPSPRRARCSCASWPAASATPTCTRPRAPTRRGYAPAVLGHEGAGVVETIGEGVKDVAVGDHVVTLFSPQCRECVHCLSARARTSAWRSAPSRTSATCPDGTTRLSRDGEPIRHFMGTSTFAEYTVMPEIALAKVPAGGAAGPLRAVRLRPLDRPRRGDVHGQGRGRARRASSSAPGMVGLGAVAGARLQGAERIICVDLSEDRLELAARPGRDRHLDRRRGHRPARARRDRRLRRRLHVRGHRASSRVMRQAVESARMGWGLCTVAGVAGKGETLDIVPRFLITGRRVCGSSLRRRQGPRPGPAARPALPRRRPRRRPVHLAPDHARRGQPRLRADARTRTASAA